MKTILILFTLFVITTNVVHSQKDSVNKLLNMKINDAILEDDTVWICTGIGDLIKANLSGEILETIHLISAGKERGLYAIAIDTNHTKWIATAIGVFSYKNNNKRHHYSTKDGLVSNFTVTIAVDKKNRKWIGTEGSGISVFDDNVWDTIKVTDYKKEVAYSIKIDSNDVKWIATYKGIFAYKDSVIEKISLGSWGYKSNGILIDSKGNKWFGTSGKGIFKYDGINLIQYKEQLIEHSVFTINEDLDGNIWTGASTLWGLTVFDGENWTKLSWDKLGSSKINSILFFRKSLQKATDKNIHLWIGTDKGLFSVSVNEDLVNIDEVEDPITSYSLAQNYPNPFNPSTTITYSLPKYSDVEIKIYNLLGNDITTLVSQLQEKGIHSVNWDASKYSSGIYIYKITTDTFVDSKKMLLIK